MKDCLILGAIHGITYDYVFNLFKDKELRTGYNTVYYYQIDTGLQRVGECFWYTTLAVEKDKQQRQMVLTKTYDPDKYKTYDDYDAIEVGSYKDIPIDYQGPMGAPVSVLLRNWPEDEYEIVDGPVRPRLNGKTKFPRAIIRRKQL